MVAAGLHRLVETDHRVTSAVSLVPTPGHTPGHVSVRISSAGAEALIGGDMIHHPVQVAEPDWAAAPDGDPEWAATTRKRVLGELADSGTLLIGTHFAAPSAGYVRRTDDALPCWEPCRCLARWRSLGLAALGQSGYVGDPPAHCAGNVEAGSPALRETRGMEATAHYKAPGWFTKNVFNPAIEFATRHGLSVWGSRVLAVKGRKSGEWRTTPVNLLTIGEHRYLVAPRGETQWVKNIRVVGGGELRVGKKVEPFTIQS